MNDELTVSLPSDIAAIVTPVDTTLLETYEDHVAAAIEQINKRESSSWGLADIFLSLTSKFGEASQVSFSSQLGIPRSTITNYMRTAKAFPPAQRLADVSFSHHLEASFADNYDKDQRQFLSQERFEWVNKAADQKMAARHLHNAIHQDKMKKEQGIVYFPCNLCAKADIDVLEYAFVSRDPNSPKRKAENMFLHEACFEIIKRMIDEVRATRLQAQAKVENEQG